MSTGIILTDNCEHEKRLELQNLLNEKGLLYLFTVSDLKRFLCARKYDVTAALTMIEAWEKWYYQEPLPGQLHTPRNILNDIDDPMEELHVRLCPISHMGEDKEGRPIYWEKSGLISGRFSQLIEVLSVEDMLARHVRNSEITTCRMNYLSKKYDRDITQQVVVFDLKDLTYTLDSRILSVFSRCSTLDNDYYPERLYRCYMINAPWYFTAVWSLLHPFLDPITSQKIHILGSNFLDTLLEQIDVSQIPVEYGGKWESIQWSWPYPDCSGCSPSQIEEYNRQRQDR